MKKKISFGTILILILLALLMRGVKQNETVQEEAKPSAPISESGDLRVHYIDVEQGDSIFIQLPNGETMLIDAGENDMGETVCDYIGAQGDTKIDYLVGTHPHSDHIGGLDTVIEAFDIGTLYLPDVSHDTKTFMDVVETAKVKGVKAEKAKAGVEVLKTENLAVQFLSPVSAEYEEMNDYSAVVSVTYGNNRFLFMGDAEYTVENQLKGSIGVYDVLKVGHHGSNSSSTANFLEQVQPKYAVISCGTDNKYGHPTQQVLSRLERFGCEIFRTDEQGSVVAVSDGSEIHFETER